MYFCARSQGSRYLLLLRFLPTTRANPSPSLHRAHIEWEWDKGEIERGTPLVPQDPRAVGLMKPLQGLPPPGGGLQKKLREAKDEMLVD